MRHLASICFKRKDTIEIYAASLCIIWYISLMNRIDVSCPFMTCNWGTASSALLSTGQADILLSFHGLREQTIYGHSCIVRNNFKDDI